MLKGNGCFDYGSPMTAQNHPVHSFHSKVGRVLFVAPAIIVLLFLVFTYAGRVAASVPKIESEIHGAYALRHFFASWCINRRKDGGLELPIKLVQERLGHSTIVMTSDVYGHLFPSRDDEAELAAAERVLLSPMNST